MKTVCLRAQGRNKTLNSAERVNEMYIVINKAEAEDYEPQFRVCLRAQGGNKTLNSAERVNNLYIVIDKAEAEDYENSLSSCTRRKRR